MAVKLKSKKKPQSPDIPKDRFTKEDIDWLFSQNKNWVKFYKENESKLWESKIDVYSWPVYPLHTKDDEGLYRCILHSQVEVKMGPDEPPKLVFFKNVNYCEFIFHCIYYKPEEHKKYIIEKLFKSDVNSPTTTTTTRTTTSSNL